MTATLNQARPPDPPVPDQEPTSGDLEHESFYDDTTVRGVNTRQIRAIVAMQNAPEQPDELFTADWHASEVSVLRRLIEQHERNAERDDRVIDRLLDSVALAMLQIDGLMVRAETAERKLAETQEALGMEKKRCERLAQHIARGNCILQSGLAT